MATEIRNALNNLVSTVEAATTSTKYAGTTGFRHAGSAYSTEDIDTIRGSTRLFIVTLTGDSTPTGPMGQLTEPLDSEEVAELVIAYPMGKNAWELMQVIAEDHAVIRYKLMLTTAWDAANTGIMRRQVSGYSIDTADAEDGSSAVVVIPVRFRYRPTFD